MLFCLFLWFISYRRTKYKEENPLHNGKRKKEPVPPQSEINRQKNATLKCVDMSVCEWERERDKNENKLKQMGNGRRVNVRKMAERRQEKWLIWFGRNEWQRRRNEWNHLKWLNWNEKKRLHWIHIYSYTCCRRSYGMSVKRFRMAWRQYERFTAL